MEDIQTQAIIEHRTARLTPSLPPISILSVVHHEELGEASQAIVLWRYPWKKDNPFSQMQFEPFRRAVTGLSGMFVPFTPKPEA